MDIDQCRTALEMKRLFDTDKEEDRKYSDELMTYFRIHYKWIHVSSENFAYHVGEIYYEAATDKFWVILVQFHNTLHMAEIRYDLDGNLTDTSKEMCSVTLDVLDKKEDCSTFEYIGTYFQYINDDEFRKMIYLRYYKKTLEGLLDVNSRELKRVNEVLAMNPYDRKIYEVQKKVCGEHFA